MIYVAGPNGSGKSTLIAKLAASGDLPASVQQINADEIAKEMADPKSGATARAAQQAAIGHCEAAIAAGRSFLRESVMSHVSHLEMMRDAQAAGFWVTLWFVCTDDPRINVDRVRERVGAGGHDVPEDRVRGRYDRVLAETLPQALLLADNAVLFDNSKREGRAVATVDDGVLRYDPADCPDWLRRSVVESPALAAAPALVIRPGPLA